MTTYVVRIDLPGIEADTPEEAAKVALECLRDAQDAQWEVEVAEDVDQDLALGLEDSVMVTTHVMKSGTIEAVQHTREPIPEGGDLS